LIFSGFFREVLRKLDQIIIKQDKILERENKIMALAQEILDLIKKVDEATNAVAARIDRLAARIGTSLSSSEVTDIKAALAAESDRLQTLGRDPANPIPLDITPPTLPNGKVGTPYSQTLTAAGATAPTTWTVSAGTPPPGVTLSAAGVLSGTPTTAGPAQFTAKVTDSATPTPRSGTRPFTLTVTP